MIDFDVSGRSHQGRIRPRNEDAWIARPDLGLVAVADGMGGHPAGDVASRLALDALVSALEHQATSSAPEEMKRTDAGERMGEAVRSAHDRILADGREHPARSGMGTTLTALRLDREREEYTIGHVGDSRVYRLRKDRLEPLTRDHSPLQEAVDEGRMSREEARVHPMGHVLSLALGTSPDPEPQIAAGEALPGDLFLLCSDGLTAVLSEERIRDLLLAGLEGDASLDALVSGLIDETLDGGAPDNITVALLRTTGS